MRRRVFAWMLPLLVLAQAGAAAAGDVATPDAEGRFQALLAAAKAGDSAVDWTALRLAYAARPSFSVMDPGPPGVRKAMFDAMRARDYPTALAKARQLIDADYVDGEATTSQRARRCGRGISRRRSVNTTSPSA